MDYKKELKSLLDALAAKGVSRDKIEEDLRYSKNYLDKVLSMGGNERVNKKIKLYFNEKQYALPKDGLSEDRAVIKTLVMEVAKLKSKVYGISVEDAIEELQQNSKIALRL